MMVCVSPAPHPTSYHGGWWKTSLVPVTALTTGRTVTGIIVPGVQPKYCHIQYQEEEIINFIIVYR